MTDPPSTPVPARGRFIVLEGIDGSGTTTQAHALRHWFERAGHPVVSTREPSNGPVGMLIRLALTRRLVGASPETHDGSGAAGAQAPIDVSTLALLFAADRADHVATQVRPSLDAGRHVLCDRYLLSTLAYQGLEVDDEWLREINRPALTPDLTLFLDVPAELAAERMRGSRLRREMYEEEAEQRRIRARYLELIGRKIPAIGPVVVLDGSRPADAVTREVTSIVDTLLVEGRVAEGAGETAS
jgi:dTMP kinase